MITWIRTKLFWYGIKREVFLFVSGNKSKFNRVLKYASEEKSPEEIYKDVIREIALLAHEEANKNDNKSGDTPKSNGEISE